MMYVQDTLLTGSSSGSRDGLLEAPAFLDDFLKAGSLCEVPHAGVGLEQYTLAAPTHGREGQPGRRQHTCSSPEKENLKNL